MSNILAIPLTHMEAQTGNNEDWIESIKYLVGTTDDTTTIDMLPQLDLRNIEFEMEIRRKPSDHEVVLAVSTANRRMGVGSFPNFGFLLIQVPLDDIKILAVGTYVADVVARDGNFIRKIIDLDLIILEGITR